MRDFRAFPITHSEILSCLERLATEIRSEGRHGDPRPMLLRAAAKIVAADEAKLTAAERDGEPG